MRISRREIFEARGGVDKQIRIVPGMKKEVRRSRVKLLYLVVD